MSETGSLEVEAANEVRETYTQIRASLDPRLDPSMPEWGKQGEHGCREVFMVDDDIPYVERRESLPDYDQLLAPTTYSAEDFANDFYHSTFPKHQWSHEVLGDEAEKAAEVYSKAVTPDEKEALRAYADFHEWIYLALPGSPLPADFILVENPAEEGIMSGFIKCPKVVPHPRSILSVKEAENYAYDQWESDIETYRAGVKKDVEESVRKLIMSTPVYRLLHSFRANAPTRTEQPLTLQEIAARQSEILEHVYQHHSLDRSESIDTKPGIRQEYGRAISMLDDETRFHKISSKHEDPAVERARAFFIAHGLQDTYLEHGPSEKIFKFIEDLHLDSEIAEHIPNSTRKSSAHDLIKAVVGHIFASGYESMSYDERLLEVVRRSTHALADPYLTYYDTRDQISQKESRAAYNIKRPDAPVYSTEEYAALQEQYAGKKFNTADQTTAYFTPIEEIAEKEATTLASVEQRGHDSYNGYRLIIAVSRDEDLQNDRAQATLLIRCHNNDIVPVGHDMYIPGYELVYRDEAGTFGFAKTDEDPYKSAEVSFSDSNYASLLGRYTSYKFDPLVDYLDKNPPQTVADLETAVANTSIYTYTETASAYDARLLSDFRSFLQKPEGILQFQCTGAALFMKASLDLLLYKQGVNTSVMSGHVLEPGSKVISAAKHAQTLLVVDGQQHILDATPSDGNTVHESAQATRIGVGGLRSILKNRSPRPPKSTYQAKVKSPRKPRAIRQKFARKPKELDLDQLQAQEAQARQEEQEIIAETKRSQETELLLNSLAIALNAPNREKLLGNLGKLSEPDPLRKVAGFALRVQSGTVESDEVKSLQGYVASYKAADKTTLKTAKLPHYDKRLLTILETYLGNIPN